jgi:beta-galactosidase
MVMDELSDMWYEQKNVNDFSTFFDTCWAEQIARMVDKDYNHPCVVLYSTGNEISDINTERGFEVAHEIYQRLRAQDPTRWVTNGVNGAFAAGDEIVDIAQDLTGEPRATFEQGDVNQFMGLMATRMGGIVTHPVVTRVLERLDASVDVQGYNYMTERYAPDAQAYPQRVMLGTETNPRRVAENWELIERLPQVIGEFTWTGWDYLGELRAPYPAWRNDAGDLSLFGLRTPVSYWREIVFGLRTAPYLAVRPPEAHGTPREFGPWRFTDALARWTWDVAPGTPMTVEVYAPGERVRLWLNGELVAEPELSEHYALVELPYAPGELVAEGADGQRHVLRTAEGPAHVVVDDFACDGWVISRIHLEDASGTWLWGDGRTHDCTRAGLELVAAGSDASLPPFADAQLQLVGQGALAIYRQA